MQFSAMTMNMFVPGNDDPGDDNRIIDMAVAQSIWFGELSLAGEVRPVAHPGLRLKEAAKLGFTRACGPEVARGDTPPGLRHDALRLLPNLVDRIMASP